MTQIHWIHPISGDFSDGADWNGGVPPGAGDQAILGAAGAAAYTVTASTNETVKALQTASNATLSITGGQFDATSGTGVGANAGLISVGEAANLALSGGVDNLGTIALTSAAQGARLTIGASGATFTGAERSL